ncbi:MAG: hypothetical protein ROW52_05955 [Anaerolineaceae bacterium]
MHLIGDTPAEISQMVQRLEGRTDISAIELGIPPKASAAVALSLVQAAGIELPVVAGVPLDRASEDWLPDLPAAGASAICIGAPRGALPTSRGSLASGRLYGPGLFPQALHAVQRLQRLPAPLIAGCGVYRLSDGQALLDAGAWAVQLDLALWAIEATQSA